MAVPLLDENLPALFSYKRYCIASKMLLKKPLCQLIFDCKLQQEKRTLQIGIGSCSYI